MTPTLVGLVFEAKSIEWAESSHSPFERLRQIHCPAYRRSRPWRVLGSLGGFRRRQAYLNQRTRMPVILPEELHDAWLSGEAGKEVLVPFPADP